MRSSTYLEVHARVPNPTHSSSAWIDQPTCFAYAEDGTQLKVKAKNIIQVHEIPEEDRVQSEYMVTLTDDGSKWEEWSEWSACSQG